MGTKSSVERAIDFVFPFPVLHISRIESGTYKWVLTYANQPQPIDEDVGISSIKECLLDACRVLQDDSPAVEVRYRDVSVGTFQIAIIQSINTDVADLIVSRYTETMQGI